MSRKIILVVILCFYFNISISSDFIDIKIDKYKSIITKDKLLMDGNLGIFPLNESKNTYVIISVGVASIDNFPQGQIIANRIAEVDARNKVSEYINGFFITHKKEMTKKVTYIIASEETKKIIEKTFSDFTRKKSKGFIKGFKKVGSWKSIDRKTLYFAIAQELQIFL